MMRKTLIATAALGLWCGVGASYASAQFGSLGQGRSNPFVNPNANTFQGGGGFNTYGILRPPFDPSRSGDPFYAMQRLNPDGSLQGLLAAQQNLNVQPLQTGHTVTWLDYQHYFPLNVPVGSTATTGGVFNTGSGFGSGFQNPAGLMNTGTFMGYRR